MAVDDAQAQTFRRELLGWADANLRDFPWRETSSPYEVFVAEILLSKTPVSKVEPMYATFLDRYPSLYHLAGADQVELAGLLYPLGLQNRRAAALINIGEQLADSGIPNTEEELLELPYVGKYAANATLCFAFGHCRPIVDTNVYRVYDRVFEPEIDDPYSEDTWQFAEEMLPNEEVQRYNLALIDFGAAVCTSRNPECDICFANDYCTYYRQTNR